MVAKKVNLLKAIEYYSVFLKALHFFSLMDRKISLYFCMTSWGTLLCGGMEDSYQRRVSESLQHCDNLWIVSKTLLRVLHQEGVCWADDFCIITYLS